MRIVVVNLKIYHDLRTYTRSDGTEVKAHWRSKPGGGSSSGQAADINNKDNTQEKTQESKEKTSQKEENEKLYPEEIAGVKRGEPKSFVEMMQQGVNPKYMSEEDKNGEYSKNCASCTVAAEIVQRGYDVETVPWSTPEAKELSNINNSAYLDPNTGEEIIPNIIDTENNNCYDYIDNIVKENERYEITYNLTPENAELSDTETHVVLVTRNEDGELLIYDPQNGETAFGDKECKLYIDSYVNEQNTEFEPRILRVDDKALNPKYVNAVVKKRSKH